MRILKFTQEDCENLEKFKEEEERQRQLQLEKEEELINYMDTVIIILSVVLVAVTTYMLVVKG